MMATLNGPLFMDQSVLEKNFLPNGSVLGSLQTLT